jgi:hypothetical protein
MRLAQEKRKKRSESGNRQRLYERELRWDRLLREYCGLKIEARIESV